ncbi:unnamed protein product [Didymodactylos carnosus]|uniref:Laminin G domain-containing protein n=1 Tax=Didymodactylos carnosus TaxID=1234261 RepID=A0A815KV63_9BILA|nr:unnamed protein product [Didymodactylos carnosus]CAF1471646.1 unnamed protein product [Didymodactylos carnosus]CAF4263336.1 unnamed protein product [Didymodactylos carnosus]CAF4288946.1 unnamed protein product [Didymodactylos carnosus]
MKFGYASGTLVKRFHFNDSSSVDTFSLSFWFFGRGGLRMYFTFEDNKQEEALRLWLRLRDQSLLQFYCTGMKSTRTLHKQFVNGEWHHVGIVYSMNMSALKFYLNGNQKFSDELISRGIKAFPSLSLEIESTSPSYAAPLADVAVWSKELTSFEIGTIYSEKTSINRVHFDEVIFQRFESRISE